MPPAAGPLDALWGVLVLALLAAAGNAARNPAARARLRAALPAVGFGLAWFAASSVPLTFVYPMWMPHRAVFGGLGLAVALIACLAAARPLLLAALVAVWLAAFGTSPGPPAHVTMAALETGSFLDFPKLVRLQRLMRETRGALARHRPTLPPGARVGLLRPPLHAEYAYGRDLALQCWYRDTTLRLLRWEEFRGWTERRLDAVLEFDEVARPQMRWVEPEAMRLYAVAASLPERDAWQAALDTLARAEALQSDREAHGFLGRVRGLRAFCFLGLGRTEDAEAEARRSLALWPEGGDARYTLAAVLAYSGRPEEARGHLDTLLALHPGDRSGMALRDSLAR
jgi:tetratricopeptide (TPR) repeat protein